MRGLSYTTVKHTREELEDVKEDIVRKNEQFRSPGSPAINGDNCYSLEQMQAYHTAVDELVTAVEEEYGHIADMNPRVETSPDTDSDELAYCQERDTADEIARAQNILEHLRYIRDHSTAELDELEHPRLADGWDEDTLETYLIETHGDNYAEEFNGFETNQDILQHLKQIAAGPNEPDVYYEPSIEQIDTEQLKSTL